MAARKTVGLVADVAAVLGEGPVWVAAEQALYWVDIKGFKIWRHRPEGGELTTWETPYRVCSLAPRAAGGFIAGTEDGFSRIDLDGDRFVPLVNPEPERVTNRFNDGKLDRAGRFWAGTMDNDERAASGALYRLGPGGEWARIDDGYKVTNGPAFSLDGRLMYHNDSARQVTYAFDLDGAGNASNRRVHLQFGDGDGYPDGMTVDREGCLWIAFWDGWCVRRFSPEGELIDRIDTPVSRPTSCAFGGRALDRLFITSASIGLGDDERRMQPHAGGLFVVEPGVVGVADTPFPGLTCSSEPKEDLIANFMFATGIENSIPTVKNGRVRVDQMDVCGHYERWREDFDLVEDMGIQFLRYGPPIHRTFLAPGKYDWEFSDLTFAELERRDITPIVDLCHFGVPDWIGNFQNPDFAPLFARYAADFAERYPWVQLYTPVNEMFICAIFSAKYGWWNEQLRTDRSFVTALKHIVKANVLAMTEILKRRPDAIFIQSESSEYFHADSPAAIGPAEVMNSRRFLSLDLNYGRRVDSEMYEYLLDNGMTREEYHFFLNQRLKQHCILGNDYYMTNEHRVHADGLTESSGEVFGYTEITRQYYDRYRLPVMHTETNLREGPNGDEAVQWLWKEWASVLRLRNDGIPTVGFTWYSLTDQIDWDTALREQNGNVNPLGLYDLDRNIRNVGRAYKQLIQDWRDVLPASSVCLTVPIVPPSQAGGRHSETQQADAARRNVRDAPQMGSNPEAGP